MPSLDPSIWEAFRANPGEATFLPLYEASKSLVWTLCRRLVGEGEDARDAFQAVYARLLLLAREPAAPDAPLAAGQLIYQCAVREANRLRVQRWRRARKELVMEELPVIPDPAPRADEQAAQAELRTRLETLVATLPDKFSLPLQLHYFHGLSQTEIADLTGLNKSTISRRLEDGLRRLERLAVRAGLAPAGGVGRVAALLATVGVGAALLEPPRSLAAGLVFAHIQALTASGTLGTGSALAGAKAGLPLLTSKLAASAALALMTVAALGAWAAHAHWARSSQAQAAAMAAAAPAPKPPEPQGSKLVRLAAAPGKADPTPSPTPTATPVPTPSVTPTPTPSSMPAGPTRTLRVAAIWEDTQRPAAGTTIVLAQAGGEPNAWRAQAVASDKGVATLTFPQAWGKATLQAHNPEALPSVQEVVLPAADPLVLTLKRGARLFGTVRRADNQQPMPGARVIAYPAGNCSRQETQTGPDGDFSIDSLPPGECRLVALMDNLRSDMTPVGAKPLALAAGMRTGPVELALAPGAVVTGQVRAQADGRPVAGARVKLQWAASDLPQTEAVSDVNGFYRIHGLRLDKIKLQATGGELARQVHEVQPSFQTESRCDFALEPGGRAAILVMDQNRRPVTDAIVSIRTQNEPYPESCHTDAAGQAIVSNLGLSEITNADVSKDGFLDDARSHPIRFIAGQTSTTLELVLTAIGAAEGHIAGHVTDSQGQPVAGVTVCWDFPDNSGAVKTTTGPDGAYHLVVRNLTPNLPLVAWAKGWATQARLDLKPGTPEAPTLADFKLEPGHWLSGRVVNAQDQPLAGVNVSVSLSGLSALPRAQSEWVTGPDGQFRAEDLPPGQVQVHLYGPKIASTSEWFEQLDREIKIVARPLGVIRGRVLDRETGQPVRYFVLKTQRKGWGPDPSGRAVTSEEGYFEVTDAACGEPYELIIEAPDHAIRHEKDVIATEVGKSGEEKVIQLARGIRLSGQILDKRTGAPVADARLSYGFMTGSTELRNVSWQMLCGRMSGVRVEQTLTSGADGSFSLNVDDDQGILFIEPTAHERLFLSAAQRAQCVEGGQCVIRLAPAASLTVHLASGRLDAAQPYANLSQEGEVGNRISIDSGLLDAQGQYRWDGLAPGTYHVSVQTDTTDLLVIALARRVRLGEGEQKKLDLCDGLGELTLSGFTHDHGQPAGRVEVSLKPLFDWEYQRLAARSDADGRFRIQGLRPGKYRVELRDPIQTRGDGRQQRQQETTIELTGTTENDFDFRKGHRVTAHLVFDDTVSPEFRAGVSGAQLVSKDVTKVFERKSDDPASVDLQAAGQVTSGTITAEGRLSGVYNVHLVCGEGNQAALLPLPGEFSINNLEADVDLGELRVPALGRVRIACKIDPPVPEPSGQIQAILQPAGGTASTGGPSLSLDPKQAEQSLGNVLVGQYKLRLFAPGYKTEPAEVDASVTAGQEAGPFAFTLRPEGVIMGIVMTQENGAPKPVPPGRITLKGPGVTRALTPVELKDERTLAQVFTAGKDIAAGPMFQFHDLAASSYEVMVEAPGYPPATMTIEVTPGKVAQAQFVLTAPAKP